ncbi:MAG TPA: hypothetical protein VM598_14855 [Bdellovibrionota bacterium]|nr:hypothetical protein [Bdellovibrionota bacterium]
MKLLAALSVSLFLSGAAHAEPMSALGADSLREAFNRESDSVRVVSLLSPVCGDCQAGHKVMASVFRKEKAKSLRGFMVWLPMVEGDSAEAASTQASRLADSRVVVQGWDGGKEIGELFRSTLKLTRTAWDVYLIYPPGVKWEGKEPPAPSYWMHQLERDSGADPKLCLNAPAFARKLGAEIRKAAGKS